MKERTAIVNWSGDYEETCLQLAKHLGTSKIRRSLFNAVYGRVSKPRSKKQMMHDAGLKPAHAQQVQNELDYLARYGLIRREENNGAVKDRSRYVYSKDANVRAHRERIVRHADNPKAANKIATKRNPIPRGTKNIVLTRRALKKRKRLDVLYLTANPDKDNALRVEAEMRQVQEAVRGSRLRDNIEVHYRPAADLNSIIDGLNDLSPRIVHFSGHGYSGGIAVDHAKVKRPTGKTVTYELLAKALAATDTPPQVVVLNSCRSAGAKRALLPVSQAIVVMSDSVSDIAATAFSAKFYAGIAAGQSLKSAFAQGKVAVEAVSIGEADTSELLTASGINPAKIILT